ncbi:hypothetical protein RRG08_043050 [Elysia crispata]|uniref:Uncharacterized protein n=1 Tax=Elysia crispata TaxID=231223 RepID=A0AAE1CPG1_9GAST|nr:hypothetical protein RRG08_043050 [Elysia crispata]
MSGGKWRAAARWRWEMKQALTSPRRPGGALYRAEVKQQKSVLSHPSQELPALPACPQYIIQTFSFFPFLSPFLPSHFFFSVSKSRRSEVTLRLYPVTSTCNQTKSNLPVGAAIYLIARLLRWRR